MESSTSTAKVWPVNPVKTLVAPSCNQGFSRFKPSILRSLSHISFIVQLPPCFAIQNAPKLASQATCHTDFSISLL
jgi:hypothetical protein